VLAVGLKMKVSMKVIDPNSPSLVWTKDFFSRQHIAHLPMGKVEALTKRPMSYLSKQKGR
jgi:hypothetical protein